MTPQPNDVAALAEKIAGLPTLEPVERARRARPLTDEAKSTPVRRG